VPRRHKNYLEHNNVTLNCKKKLVNTKKSYTRVKPGNSASPLKIL